MVTCSYYEHTGDQAAPTHSGDTQRLTLRTSGVTKPSLCRTLPFPLQHDNRGWGTLLIGIFCTPVTTGRELYR